MSVYPLTVYKIRPQTNKNRRARLLRPPVWNYWIFIFRTNVSRTNVLDFGKRTAPNIDRIFNLAIISSRWGDSILSDVFHQAGITRTGSAPSLGRERPSRPGDGKSSRQKQRLLIAERDPKQPHSFFESISCASLSAIFLLNFSSPKSDQDRGTKKRKGI
jgi:hypothetical protein